MENCIVLKKYFNDNDYKQIGELEKVCIADDKSVSGDLIIGCIRYWSNPVNLYR